MDQQRFETILKAYSLATSRREALKLLVFGIAGSLSGPARSNNASAVSFTQHIVECESLADCLQRAADEFSRANEECATEYRCRGRLDDGCIAAKIACYPNAVLAYNDAKSYCRSQDFADRGGCPEGWHCSNFEAPPDFEGPVVTSRCCEDGQENCGGGCVDLLNDPETCGECGNVCPAGQPCTNGECGRCAVDLDCNAERCEFCDPATGTCASRCDPTQCQSCEPATGACVPFECPDGKICDACGCLDPGYKRCPDYPGDSCFTCPEAKTCDTCGCLDAGYKRCPDYPDDPCFTCPQSKACDECGCLEPEYKRCPDHPENPCFTCPETKTCDQCGCLEPGYKRCPNHPNNACYTCPESKTCDDCGCLERGYKRCPNHPGNPCYTCPEAKTCDRCGCLTRGYTRCSNCDQCPPGKVCAADGGCAG